MNMNANKTKTLGIKILGIILVIAVGSYALWQITKKQSNQNIVGTTCLHI